MKKITYAIVTVLFLLIGSCGGNNNPSLEEALAGTNSTSLFDIDSESLSILFVGNSYLAHRPYVDGNQTRFSVYQQLVDLIEIDIPDVRHRMRSIGGGTLQEHWELGISEGTPRHDIANGDYDLLVIQGRYDILQSRSNKNRFDEYADSFTELALQNNLKVLFYGLWATDSWISLDSGDEFNEEANEIYCNVAIRNSVACAPNGIAHGLLYNALGKTMSETEVEDLLTVDRVHPYPPLAYMAANVVYQVIFGEQAPPQSVYNPPTLEVEFGNLIRDTATQAVDSHALNLHSAGD